MTGARRSRTTTRARPDPIARLRRICMALPEAREKLSHGEPTWFAGTGKSFAMLDDHHHGAPHLSVWLPQPVGAQEALIAADAARFFRPPYVGASGWVGVVLDTGPDWGEVERLVRDAYVTVARPRLQSLLSGERDEARAPDRRARPSAGAATSALGGGRAARGSVAAPGRRRPRGAS